MSNETAARQVESRSFMAGRTSYHPTVTTDNPQTIAYPAPGSRPHRRDGENIEPHVIVLFGATGDLAKRKLLPGMAYLVPRSWLPKIRVVGTSLEDLTERRVPRADQGGRRLLRQPPTDRRAVGGLRQPHHLRPAGRGSGGARRGGRRRRGRAGAGHPSAALSVGAAQGRQGRHHHAQGRRPGRAVPGGDGEAVRHRPGQRDRAQRLRARDVPTSGRSSASTTSWARRRRRTSWPSASPTACSSRSGTATSSTTSRSTSPKSSASMSGPTSTRAPAPSRTWSSPTCSR